MPPSLDASHRTSDLWEAAFVWALGSPLVRLDVDDDDHVTWVFPDGGDDLREQVMAYRRGIALVNPASYRQGYLEMRRAMSRELRDADAR